MIITKHAIERFKERVTDAPIEVIRGFIESDIRNSDITYTVENTQKRIINGIAYVCDCTTPEKVTVVTLYLC